MFLLHKDKWLCSQKSLHISSSSYGCIWTELLTCSVCNRSLVTEAPKSGTSHCVDQSLSFCPQRYPGHILIQETCPCLEVTHKNANVQTPGEVSCIDFSQSLLLTILKIDPGVTKQELRAVFLQKQQSCAADQMCVKLGQNLTAPCESNINGSWRPLEDPLYSWRGKSLMFFSFRPFMDSKS